MLVPNSSTDLVQDMVRTKFVCNYLERMAFYSEAFIGDYKYSARPSDYHGWLLCDGRSISRAIYKNLFDIVGTAFGSNDADTFKLPNFKGRVPGATGTGTGLTARALGAIVGFETHTLNINEMPSHGHSNVTGAAGSHDHGGHTGSFNAGTGSFQALVGFDSVGNDSGEHTHTIPWEEAHKHPITPEGGGQPHNNMQPTLFAGNLFMFAGIPLAVYEGTAFPPPNLG